MKTQISRDGFRADRRYSGVYQQQGRLITDSDWNELVDIVKDRLDQALVDVVGSGSPKGRAAAIQISGGAPKIVPGVIYAGGVEARVAAAPGITANPFDYDKQADFPSPPPPPANSYRLYADVWERPVVALEDDGLRDPALHGADTCTRTQTMAQIKWCPLVKDPASSFENPGKGNGTLTVAYPQGGGQGGADPCDPQVQEVDPIGGDFLLRVEVHDARWPANVAPSMPDRVVVKWSRENGAEQFDFEEAPDWFKAGPWLFELFNVENEKHQGFHLSNHQTWTPKRAILTPTLPQAAPAGVTSVRRWDGYVVLVRTGNTWGVSALAGELPGQTAPGAAVGVTNGKLTVGLAVLELTLDVAGKVFLPGDAWSVPVRRATYLAGQKLLDAAQPTGILHRYVVLADVQGDGTLRARTSAEQRRLAFPTLTDIAAADIGFAKPCNTSVYKDANVQTIADALGLLCNVKAEQIGYTTGQLPAVQEVKTALDELYKRVGGSGNRFTVGPPASGAQYPTIQAAISDLRTKTTDIALALMPGNHNIGVGFNPGDLTGMHLSLLGVGGGTRITAGATISFTNLASVSIDSLDIQFFSTKLQFSNCQSVSIERCRFGGSQTVDGLVVIAGAKRVRIQDNWIDVPWHQTDPTLMAVLEPNLGGYADIEDLFGVSWDRFDANALLVGQTLAGLAQQDRTEIGDQIMLAAQQNGVSNEESTAYKILALAIKAALPIPGNIASGFRSVRTVTHIKSPGTAIILADANAATHVQNNQIVGFLGLFGAPAPSGVLTEAQEKALVLAVQNFGRLNMTPSAGTLVVSHNEITGIRCANTVMTGVKTALNNNTQIAVPGLTSLVVRDNVFDKGKNHLMSQHIGLESNLFRREDVGWALGISLVAMGNRANDFSDLFTGVPANKIQFLGNVLLLMNPS